MYYLGLDVGTQGARAVVVDGRGVCYANASVDFAGKATVTDLPPGRQEQDPRVWATSLEHAILQAVGQLDDVGVSAGDLAAAAVTSTSGTVLALDADGKPLRPALMYNDARAGEEAAEVARVGADHCARHGYRPGASFGLPKLLWLVRHEPETVDGARHLVHATDYLTGRLCGRHGVSNASDALKSCCDLFDQTWPAFLAELGIPVEKLPRLHTPGDVLGVVDPGVAERLGLPPGLKICAGCTDGTAGFLASGAAAPGESNTTIGTTLVLRTVSPDIVRDPDGRVYCHRHPDGAWLPGGASSVGAECLRVRLPDCDLDALAEHAAGALPSDSLAYPLVRPGERFPFVDPGADGFFEPEPDSETELYAAILQGVAFVERWCYEVLGELGCPVDGAVYTVGGGARSPVWNQLRADVLGRDVVLPRMALPAVGAAILAARGDGVEGAFRSLVSIRETREPDARRHAVFTERYHAFRQACRARGLGPAE